MLTNEIDSWIGQVPAPAVAVSVFDRKRVLARAVKGAGESAWWDLASLTKVLVTLPEALAHLDLDATLGRLWSRARGMPAGAVTVRQLLSHSAGLPVTAEFFRFAHTREDIVGHALAVPLRRDGQAVYSDIGYLLLGELIAEVTGAGLDELAWRRTGLRYAPLPGPAVPTEICSWRRRLIVGEVHDENASAMGGTSGHAGAFGTLDLVTAAARHWWAPQQRQAANLAGERFGLGWWLRPTRGIGGPDAGPNTYGHTGFVGNQIWFDPDAGIGVVVLSNRIHPHRTDRAPFARWCDGLALRVRRSLRRNGRSA